MFLFLIVIVPTASLLLYKDDLSSLTTGDIKNAQEFVLMMLIHTCTLMNSAACTTIAGPMVNNYALII